MDKIFCFKNKLLVLRIHRLGHLPPAHNAVQILSEQGFPVLVVEYENLREKVTYVAGGIVRRRMACPSAVVLPRFLRASYMNLRILGRLLWGFLLLHHFYK